MAGNILDYPGVSFKLTNSCAISIIHTLHLSFNPVVAKWAGREESRRTMTTSAWKNNLQRKTWKMIFQELQIIFMTRMRMRMTMTMKLCLDTTLSSLSVLQYRLESFLYHYHEERLFISLNSRGMYTSLVCKSSSRPFIMFNLCLWNRKKLLAATGLSPNPTSSAPAQNS